MQTKWKEGEIMKFFYIRAWLTVILFVFVSLIYSYSFASEQANKQPRYEATEGKYREAFITFDKDGNDSISKEEFHVVFKELGKNLSNKELEVMFVPADSNGDNKISFEEFKVIMIELISEKQAKHELSGLFNLFDKDSSGAISKQELVAALKVLDENHTNEELENTFTDADFNSDNELSFEEFEEKWKQK